MLARPALAAVLLVASLSTPTRAREDGATRKGHHSQPARTGQTAPDRTGSIGRVTQSGPTPETPPAPAVTAIDEGPLTPVLLPSAPRGRMVACGEAWRARKMAGTTGDDTWREFAETCLVAKEAPRP